MMSVLGLPGRPPRDQLSLCGVVITGEPGAATKAYRHDYNLLLPQIVSPVALLWPASSHLSADLTPFYTTTTYLPVVSLCLSLFQHHVNNYSSTTYSWTVGHHMETFRPLLSVLCRAGPSDEVQCPAVRCLVL